MTNIEINIKRTISDEMIDAIFDAAFYSGIQYWCPKADPVKTNALTSSATLFEDEEETGKNMIEHQIDGPKIIAAMKHIIEGETPVRIDIRDYILNAVIDTDAGHIDSECADVIFQIACFGEVKYG